MLSPKGLKALLPFLLTLWIVPAYGQTPTLTQAQAIQTAAAFCQAVGAPIADTSSATAVFPAPPLNPSRPDTYYLPRWRVDFPACAQVEIVDATQMVSRYYNSALSAQALQANAPAGTPLSQDTLTQKAQAVLQAAGPATETAGAPTINMWQMASPATSAGDLCIATWPRQYQSIPYRDQKAIIILQAETGNVQAYNLAYPFPAPASYTQTVTQAQATQTASAQLASAGISGATLQTAEVMVVEPNTFWQPGGNGNPQPNATGQVAWDCKYQDASGALYEVWVDAASGSVIGGESAVLAGGGHKPSAKVGKGPMVPRAK